MLSSLIEESSNLCGFTEFNNVKSVQGMNYLNLENTCMYCDPMEHYFENECN